MQRRPKIVILAGSIRDGSFNQKLADAYAGELTAHDCEITRILLSDYPMPIVDQNLESEKGVPDHAMKLARLFHQQDGMILVGPEYNASISPLLKNTIDWISRAPRGVSPPLLPFKNKVCAIASASNGAMGGYTSLLHLRDVMVRLGALVLSEQLALGNAATAFEEDGRLKEDLPVAKLLQAVCTSLIDKSARI